MTGTLIVAAMVTLGSTRIRYDHNLLHLQPRHVESADIERQLPQELGTVILAERLRPARAEDMAFMAAFLADVHRHVFDDAEDRHAASACIDLSDGLAEAVQQLAGYSVTAGGSPVTSEFIVEPFARGSIKPFPGSDALKNIAGWMVSEVVRQ